MFNKEGIFYTNKNQKFLQESDLIIYWNSEVENKDKNFVVVGSIDESSKVDIPKSSVKLPLLLARLAYVFEVYDEALKDTDEFEDFVDILKGVRVKKEINNHSSTLEEISGVLYLIDEANKISIIVGDVKEEELETLMSFAKMIGFDKVGVFSKNEIDWSGNFYE
jgi:hypothetical protein